ncbi:MAG: acetyl-CoA synthetase [Dorea sp.]|jgi:acyl-CoA synthetase (NDP forming)|nr:acetyl-CoA synthetase [Dorea sp.]
MDRNLNALFDPENIAVIGASNNPLKAGYTVIQNLNQIGYPKKVFPVTPSEKEILGRDCYEKLSDIEERVELVVLATPAKLIYHIMEDLTVRFQTKNDVKVIVCIAADYGETRTEEGIRRQECLMDTAKKYGIRVVGPNCIGIIDNINRVDTTFVETLIPTEMRGRKGGISFISQSGAMAASILMMGASQPVPISMNKFISIGNMADVDFIDLLEYFEQDEDTKVIGMYLEGYPDGRKLIDTLARIVKKKPVVVLKVGRSSIGALAANSHTGSLAGADAVYEAAFRQYGITRVCTIEEMMDILQAFDAMHLPGGDRCFLLTQAGGPGIYCTDAFVEGKILEFPRITDNTKERLKDILPPMANICSPEGYADITAAATVEQHVESLRAVMEDDNVDSVILVTVVPTFLPRKELAEGFITLLKNKEYGSKKPVYICIMAGGYVWECRKLLEEQGIRTFTTPAHCVTAAGHMAEYHKFLKRQKGEKEHE